jgi:hypothetical protein
MSGASMMSSSMVPASNAQLLHSQLQPLPSQLQLQLAQQLQPLPPLQLQPQPMLANRWLSDPSGR